MRITTPGNIGGIPKLYFGTMNFGWSQASSNIDDVVATEMTNMFIKHINDNHNKDDELPITYNIDTARIYAGGKTEKILGNVLKNIHQNSNNNDNNIINIGTKAHPSQKDGLSPIGIEKQLFESLNVMNIKYVNEYYLHQPDPNNDIVSSLRKLSELKKKGYIKGPIGCSNYHVDEMKRIFDLCNNDDTGELSLAKPTVYQGLYNPLNRLVEDELIPLLRKNNCSFVAYNPLAAGLLTGKHKRRQPENDDNNEGDDDTILKGRFYNNDNYIPRFYTKENFNALDIISKACNDANINIIDATYRWLMHHSMLNKEDDDGILIGASSIKQLKENLSFCTTSASEPLPDNVLLAIEDAWVNYTSKSNPFPYWRSYSKDMPNRENLNQGASYEATKK